MKVDIGNYTTWIGPYQIANKLKWFIGHRNTDNFGHWLNNTWIRSFCEWVHSKKIRKVKVKIDYYDTWSLDHTLALIILPALKKIRSSIGIPFVDDDDVPTSLKSPASYLPEKAKWDWVLDEIIWSFQQIVDDSWEDQFHKNGFDSVSYSSYQKRISNGLILFGKYYQSLWT